MLASSRVAASVVPAAGAPVNSVARLRTVVTMTLVPVSSTSAVGKVVTVVPVPAAATSKGLMVLSSQEPALLLTVVFMEAAVFVPKGVKTVTRV